jgi:trk system potassium uptake protein TrkH
MSCLGGIGPAIGIWGPTESYASASVATKWVLICLMLIGRLEIYTVLVLIRPWYRKRQPDNAVSLEHLEDDALIEPLVREK